MVDFFGGDVYVRALVPALRFQFSCLNTGPAALSAVCTPPQFTHVGKGESLPRAWAVADSVSLAATLTRKWIVAVVRGVRKFLTRLVLCEVGHPNGPFRLYPSRFLSTWKNAGQFGSASIHLPAVEIVSGSMAVSPMTSKGTLVARW